MIPAILLNGLWQGVLIVAIAAFISLAVPQRHAATRYAVWFVALLALLALPVVTLWHPTAEIAAPTPPIVARTTAIAARATSDNSWWIIVLWLTGVALFFVRLVRSHLRIGRIMKAALPAPAIGPDVMTSHEVAYPIAAGFFAPMVILPANVTKTLERSDVEAIVRHERAHIARRDILTNLAQRLIEACLFFNPWVYVIGRQLLKEREAACDDWVVATADADRYASCLAQLASGPQPARAPLLTPSAIGSRRMLVGRIARLLNGKAMQLKTNYLVLGASALAFALLAVVLQTTTGQAAPTTVANGQNIPACAHEVEIVNAVSPNISKADFKPNVTARVLVTVDASGNVTSAKVMLSSGSTAIDNATLEAAKKSTYKPGIGIDCKPHAGQYDFHIQTGPN
jgi:TonB family protein